jgi:hypothetical protein
MRVKQFGRSDLLLYDGKKAAFLSTLRSTLNCGVDLEEGRLLTAEELWDLIDKCHNEDLCDFEEGELTEEEVKILEGLSAHHPEIRHVVSGGIFWDVMKDSAKDWYKKNVEKPVKLKKFLEENKGKVRELEKIVEKNEWDMEDLERALENGDLTPEDLANLADMVNTDPEFFQRLKVEDLIEGGSRSASFPVNKFVERVPDFDQDKFKGIAESDPGTVTELIREFMGKHHFSPTVLQLGEDKGQRKVYVEAPIEDIFEFTDRLGYELDDHFSLDAPRPGAAGAKDVAAVILVMGSSLARIPELKPLDVANAPGPELEPKLVEFFRKQFGEFDASKSRNELTISAPGPGRMIGFKMPLAKFKEFAERYDLRRDLSVKDHLLFE